MRRLSTVLMAGLIAAGLVAQAQGSDANKILAAARQALGGDAKLAAVNSLTATGHNSRGDVEIAMELPDKFIKKEVFAQINDIALSRTSGFNGSGLIDEADAPPAMNSMGGGTVFMRMGGPGMTVGGGDPGAAKANALTTAKREFARLTLGMFASSFTGYPLHLTSGGQADSGSGNADVIDVKSDDGFTGRLFVSTTTHLPLMLTWMDKEPIVMTMGGPARGGRAAGVPAPGGGNTDKMMADAQAKAREADANRRMVEFRVSYSDYKDVEGLKIPFTISRSMDGKAQDALTLDKVKLNPKIDPRKFDVSK